MIDITKRIGQFDGLRAIAILLVFVHHLFTKPVVSYLFSNHWAWTGYFLNYFTSSGVQLFYVLSGILLLRPYLHKTRVFDPKKYFKRRIERLYPTYFIVLILTALIFYFAKEYPNWYSSKQMIQFHFIDFIKQLPIFHINTPYYNPVLWSLEIEFLFYLLIPIITFFLVKLDFNGKFYILIFIILTVISLVIQNYTDRFNSGFPLNIVYTFLYYSPCFFIGIILAKFDFTQKHAYILLFIGIIYIFFSLYYAHLNLSASYGVFYAAIVILSLTNTSFSKILNNYYLIWLGERSYSFFIVHYPVIQLVNHITSFYLFNKDIYYFIITRALSIIFSLLFTILLFHFVERKKAGKLVTDNDIFPFKQKNKLG